MALIRLGGGICMYACAGIHGKWGKENRLYPVRGNAWDGGDLIVVSPQCQCNASTTMPIGGGQQIRARVLSLSLPPLSFSLYLSISLLRLPKLDRAWQGPVRPMPSFWPLAAAGPRATAYKKPAYTCKWSLSILERRGQSGGVFIIPSWENNHEPQHHRKPAAYILKIQGKEGTVCFSRISTHSGWHA
jgi:hypothetical protein